MTDIYGIRAYGFANGEPCPHAGQWLAHFDHDAYEGLGYGEFTDVNAQALEFHSFEDALEFRNRQSTVRPVRPDGKPNRPLTALTLAVELLRQVDG